MAADARNFHLSAPVSARSAYRYASTPPTYRLPRSSSAGELYKPPSASNDQSDAPSAARTACNVPAMDPTKTRPRASSAGDDMTSPRVSYDHLTVPAKPPPPVAAWMAKSELSAPTYATPSSPSAAEETIGRFARSCHSPFRCSRGLT